MAKSYTVEHVAKIYNIETYYIEKWMEKIDGDDFKAEYNADFSKFLGQTPKSLKGVKKKKKKVVKGSNQEWREQQKLKAKLAQSEKDAFWSENYQKIKNFKFRESADLQVEKLITLAGSDDKIKNQINETYFSLPPAYKYIEANCSKKYFTWNDLIFVDKGLKVNPNICYLVIEINGPTKILQDIKLEYFQKRFQKVLYKVYINKETGKVEHSLSNDISSIKSLVEKHIHKNRRNKTLNSAQSTPNKIPTLSLSKNSIRSLSIEDILSHFPHNQYIQISSQLLRRKGKALAVWENNNGQHEESLLIILEHKIYSFIIWENINDNRACYIFKYNNRKFDEKLSNLIKLITSEIKYKRENLYRRIEVEDMNLLFEDYRSIIHEYPKLYKDSISQFISPYFKF